METIFGIKDHLDFGQECARAVLIFFYGLVMLRFSGKRTFGRWSALDMVISIVIGSNLSRALTGGAPLPGTLGAVAVMVVLHFLCTFAAAHSVWWSELLEGTSVIMGDGGKIDERRRATHLISDEDLREALRQAGIEKISDTKRITLEANGKITVIHKVDPILALDAIAAAMGKDGKQPAEPYGKRE